MRPASDALGRSIPSGPRAILDVTSWLGSSRLASLPVVPGTWSIDDKEDDKTPGQLTFSVPNTPQWRPTTPTHPLGAFGQVIRTRVGLIHSGRTVPEYVSVGWYRIETADPNSELLEVNAVGLLRGVERARFLKPLRINKSTRARAVSLLCKGIIPVKFSGVVDEPLSDVTYDRERLDALTEIVEGWPARKYVDGSGTLIVAPALDDYRMGRPVVSFLDGPGGTLIEANAASTPETDFNAYRVENQPKDGSEPVAGFAYVSQGPMRWGGPYGYNPGFYSSPTLPANVARLNAIANTLTLRARRRHDTIKVIALPDPRPQVGDVARVRSRAQGLDIAGRITSTKLSRTQLEMTLAYVGGTR